MDSMTIRPCVWRDTDGLSSGDQGQPVHHDLETRSGDTLPVGLVRPTMRDQSSQCMRSESPYGDDPKRSAATIVVRPDHTAGITMAWMGQLSRGGPWDQVPDRFQAAIDRVRREMPEEKCRSCHCTAPGGVYPWHPWTVDRPWPRFVLLPVWDIQLMRDNRANTLSGGVADN